MSNPQSRNTIIIRPTAEVLAQLLFGNLADEAVLELKRDVIQRFAENHLRPILNDERMQTILKALTESIKHEIELQIREIRSGAFMRFRISPDAERATQEFVSNRISNLIEAHIQMLRQDGELSTRVSRLIDERVALLTLQQVDSMVEQRLDDIQHALRSHPAGSAWNQDDRETLIQDIRKRHEDARPDDRHSLISDDSGDVYEWQEWRDVDDLLRLIDGESL